MAIYREMGDNCAIVGAGLLGITSLIKQAQWKTEPFSNAREDVARSTFVWDALNDMSISWPVMLADIMTMHQYGFAPLEIVYKRRGRVDAVDGAARSKYRDGKIGWRKLALRAQESITRWEFAAAEDGGGLIGMWQSAAPDYREVFIPIEKLLLFRLRPEKANPEGVSLLRSAYFAWYFLKRLSEIEAIGAERNAAGIAVMRIPAECMLDTAMASQKAVYTAAKKMVENLRNNEQAGVVLSSERDETHGELLYTLELLASPGGTKQADIGEMVKRYKQDIAYAMLTDILLLGHETGTGSGKALSGDKYEFFTLFLGAAMDAIAEVFNLHAIPRLAALNGWPEDRLPRLVHGSIERPNLELLGAFVGSLAGAGADIFPDESLIEHLYELAKLPITGRAEAIAAQVAGTTAST